MKVSRAAREWSVVGEQVIPRILKRHKVFGDESGASVERRMDPLNLPVSLHAHHQLQKIEEAA
jgi:hypothetical protein